MSRSAGFWLADQGQDALPVALGGLAVATAPRSAFRALYADGQEADAPAPPVEAEEPGDPLEQARIAAFTQGFEEGCRVTAESVAADQDACRSLAGALEQLSPVTSGTLSTLLSAAVIRLVGQIVGEVEIDTALLRRRCEAVAAFIEEGEGRKALHLHPEDVPLLEGAGLGVPVIADAGLRRGCVRLDTAEGWIEDGPDVRLSRLKAMLDDMEGRA